MTGMRIGAIVVLGLAVAACGGSDDDEGEPLVGGSVDGEYDGLSFTATFGFATIYQDSPILGFGDDGIHCGSEDANDPPPGHSAVVSIGAFEAGNYTNAFVQIFTNVDEFEGVGASGA